MVKDLINHFLVFRCAGCDEALPAGQVLCPECENEFRKECASPCKHCHAKHIECGCFVNGRKNPADRVLHIAPYRKSGVARSMVTLCKSTRDRHLFSFMATLITAEVERKLTPSSSWILAPVPRSPVAAILNGFDQSKLMGEQIARSLGIEFAPIIKHSGRKTQKFLGYRDRLRNAKAAFSINEKQVDLIRGKRVILYDDIITSGASATACTKLLREAGALSVDFVSFARTER